MTGSDNPRYTLSEIQEPEDLGHDDCFICEAARHIKILVLDSDDFKDGQIVEDDDENLYRVEIKGSSPNQPEPSWEQEVRERLVERLQKWARAKRAEAQQLHGADKLKAEWIAKGYDNAADLLTGPQADSIFGEAEPVEEES